MGFGSDVSGRSDLELRSMIDQASQLINSFCAAPMNHDFRGGTVVGEQHRWPLPNLGFTDQTSRRVYPLHQPLRTVEAFAVKFTNTYQVAIDPANLYINRMENWAEVVSIAAIVSGVYPVGINFGLYTPIAEVDYTYRWEFPVVKEILSPTPVATVYQAANQFWLNGATVSVYLNNVVQGSGFTLDPVEGTVTFTSAPTGTVSLSYTYTLPGPIALAAGHLTALLISEADLIAKGMGSLGAIRVEEVELRRFSGHNLASKSAVDTLDPTISAYLNPFTYMTVR